ncbi:arylsulfatase [Sphingomonas sp. dw_22]|uniref:arylsulfatase n=1 Tax=Sphingomonas sp. dw_22 TaxID=2721175 RepID=UPI001BD35B0C|nr:arylsulfatase [Sphingomonas sp. dw_22]
MKRYLFLFASLVLATSAAPVGSPPQPKPAAPSPKPNILVIVADDLGYSDLGAFGGEIHTPNLDALAERGLRLTGFHSAPTCSPTRSMLLSGTDNHLAGLGNMTETIAPNQIGRPGYGGYLPGDVVTLADRLRDLGYATLMSGKWHLGGRAEDDPIRHGFEQAFDLVQGAGNHYGRNLSPNWQQLGVSTYRENGETVKALPTDFYSSDYFATKLIEYLGKADKAKPFFAYLTFTAPHWPLQAPEADVAKYRGRYDAGFEALRRERLARQQVLGLVPRNVRAHDLILPPGQDWASLSPEEKQRQARLMEIYAAMVDRLDQNVGRVIAHLKETGQYDNTIIVFLADNGAEGMDLREVRIPGVAQLLKLTDNRFDNLGKQTSFASYGPGWAQAATTPSLLYKGYTSEGGTRVAAFINLPGASRRGGVSHSYGTVMDVLPTLVEAAGGTWQGGSFAGREVQPVRGRSWLPYLQGRAARVHAPGEAIGSELFGRRAIRQGDWKLVDLGDGWKLYNLSSDPGETRDLSKREPARVRALAAAWDDYARDAGVIMPSTPATFP